MNRQAFACRLQAFQAVNAPVASCDSQARAANGAAQALDLKKPGRRPPVRRGRFFPARLQGVVS
ncbi:hypothetical protein KL86DES1_21889 [uncultured Desulfovibrio sp.]|uniref:Uncharacterized protein n=1 Tax=uncultured Desulfovibrio sp. TaxID=167968 RepID=A0A212LA27_9BACT|nr:hypothetical protein KL86DES1_21889 [uncultured Desulfovibrio sp.]VZH34786.1 conserved protein of unknown function [Desulfovibrio sp. 86]